MTLTNQEEDEVRKKVIEMFGPNRVEKIDHLWMDLHEIRMESEHNYDFLAKVHQKFDGETPYDTELLVAAILYGIRLREIGREYAYEVERQAAMEMQYQ